MIQANELRIGNWVEAVANMGNYWMQIHAVNFESIEKNPDCVKPIPLTPEILEAAGFEKDLIDDPPAYNLAGFIKRGRLSIFLEEIQCTDGRTDWSTYIQFNVGMGFNHLVTNPTEYLHQLQNLYFSLTGQELEIRDFIAAGTALSGTQKN